MRRESNRSSNWATTPQPQERLERHLHTKLELFSYQIQTRAMSSYGRAKSQELIWHEI